MVPLSPQDEELLIRLRGDDVWTGSTHGVLRHYHEGVLVASLPTHTAEIEDIRISGDHVISVGFDATVVVDRASAAQYVSEPGPCITGSYSISGSAISYICEDGRAVAYIGRHRLGEVRDHTLVHSAIDPVSQRSAVVGKEITVFDAAGTVIAIAGEERRGPVAIVRKFEPVESYGVAAMLDATGDLLMRTSRGTLTIWKRSTGDNLVWNLEFLRGAFGAAFLPDGRIETNGERLGLIDIPRDTRPVADILADIACRVPLRVTGSRLDAAPTTCTHKAPR